MGGLVPEEPLVKADSARHAASPSRIALRSRGGARTVAVGYLVVNMTLWVVWAATGAGYPWPVWVTVASGIGLLMNAWAGLEIRRELKPPRS
jgi:hypothetical protein